MFFMAKLTVLQKLTRHISSSAYPTLSIRGRFLRCVNPVAYKAVTLSIRGRVFACVDDKNRVVEQKFDWENALIDAVITSGITFFTALGGGAVAGGSSMNIIVAATVAALSQFFIFLALKRGLIQPKEAQ
jgi:hypothetical protein